MTIEEDRSPSPTSTESRHPPLTEISNEAAALHREHFGRGPGAVKSYVTDDLIVCILSDVFTPSERTLIDALRGDQVLTTRLVLQSTVEEVCKERMELIVGRPVIGYLSTVHTGTGMAVDVYMLGTEGAKDGSTGSGTDSFH